MSFIFAKLAPGLHRNPKVRRAGRDGRDVWVFCICTNAELGATGIIPADYLEPWFLADALQCDEATAARGLQRCLDARLLVLQADGSARMIGWDDEEWGRGRSGSMTEAERKAKQRADRKAAASAATGQPAAGPDVSGQPSGRPDVSRDQRREEERRGEEIRPEVSLSAGAHEGESPTEPAVVAIGTLADVRAIGAAPGREGDLFGRLAEELHDQHAAEARKLKAAIRGCENLSIGGGPLMGETRTAILEVVSRWSAEAREAGLDTREHVTARMTHLVAVRSATARAERHLRWWSSGRFWRWAGIEIDLAQTVEQVRQRAREGGRGGQGASPPAPASSVPTAAETAAKMAAQREHERRVAAEREATAAELAAAKAALGIVGGVAKQLGGRR